MKLIKEYRLCKSIRYAFGIDDSEISITFIKSPYRKAHNISLTTKIYEFPKKFDIASLYAQLEAIALENNQKLNS